MSEQKEDSTSAVNGGPQAGFNPAGIAIGMGAGIAIGAGLDNVGIGIIIGAAMGIIFSVALGQANNEEKHDR